MRKNNKSNKIISLHLQLTDVLGNDIIKSKTKGADIMNGKLKNINKSEVLKLKEQVSYCDGQIVSRTLVQNEAVSLTLFAFEKDEEISTHESGGDALVTVLEGKGRFTVDGRVYMLDEGESIVMPAGIPHAVYGEERFKMLLTVVF